MQALFQLSYSPTIHAQSERITVRRSLLDRSESLTRVLQFPAQAPASAAHSTASAPLADLASLGRVAPATFLRRRPRRTPTRPQQLPSVRSLRRRENAPRGLVLAGLRCRWSLQRRSTEHALAAVDGGGTAPGRSVRLVGARGFEPLIPTCRIVVPSWIVESLAVAA